MASRRRFLGTVCGLAGLSTLSNAGAGSSRDVRLVDANPDAGFDYPYFLALPESVPDDERPLLVYPNNTGTTADDYAVHRQSAREQAESAWVADRLRVPLLVPAFPRPDSDPVHWRHNPHELNREVMLLDEGPLERVDLQLRRMVRHAQGLLAEEGYAIRDEVLLNGFSSSGNFSHRFAALHPDLVAAVAAGGINGMPILPVERAKGHTLNYQIGVADVNELTGSPFDRQAFRDVAFLFYMGAEDDNDTLPEEGEPSSTWSEDQVPVAYDVYGEDMQEDRFTFSESVYDDADVPAEFRLYDGVGHEITGQITDDVASFFAETAGLEDSGPQGGSFVATLEAFGVPVEAAVGGSVAVVAGTAYLLTRLDGDDDRPDDE